MIKLRVIRFCFVVCVKVFISLNELLMCAFSVDIFVTLPYLLMERIRKYFLHIGKVFVFIILVFCCMWVWVFTETLHY
jgi:hypothetical protein